MKKKILLVLSIVAVLACLFAITASAETELKPQDTNAYGELSFFDESITVGRTDNQNGFSPYIDEAGETYARVVIGDGTTFYTFPTAYVYSSTRIYGRDGKTLWSYDLSSLNSAMEAATQTNPNWTISNIYRIELPYNTVFLNNDGTQKFYAFSNVIEIYLQPNSTSIDTGSNVNCFFHSCEKLTTIHNIDSFVFKHNNNLSGTFQNCKALTSLTLGVSPAITKINGSAFNSCTSLESVNIVEAFPNCKEVGGSAFINCYALKTISSARNDGVIELSYTYFENSAFQNCDSIKAIKFTASSTKLLQSVFHSMDSLEFVSFPRNSKLELPSCEVFSNNEKLKAVAFPDDCTVIPDRGFKNCKGLYAVYLPANLYELKTNGGGQGAFAYNDDMYFVNDYFSVLDENGEFLFDKFQMPERPDVYYFPSTLTLLYKRDGGTGFDGNYNLNPVMVLPETVTELWVWDGCFYNCGTTNNQKTVVMLGNMENVRFNMRDSRTVGINYVFANPLDQDLTSVNIVDTADRVCYNVTNETIYFCSTGKTYALSQWEAHPDPATFELTTENKHLRDPKKDADKDATCTSAAGSFTYCFCGKEISFVAEEGSVALGHIYDDSNIVEKILPTLENGKVDFYSDSTYVYACPQCSTDVSRVEVGTSFFTKSGYSSNEEDKANVVFVIVANYKNIQQYVGENDAEIAYGVVVSANTTGTPLSYVDGQVKEGANTVKVDMTNTSYSKMTVKVTKVGDLSLHCCGYISFNGEISYLNHATVDDTALEVSLSIIDSILNPQVTPPVEEDPSEEIPVE